MKRKNLQQVDEGFGKLIGTAAKGLWKAVKPALKEVAKDVAKDIAKDAARAGIQMAKDGLGKLNNALIGKIQKVSPTTAEIIQKTGMMFLDYCAKNNLTEDSLTQYADKFIDKSLDGADENDAAVLQDMKDELDNTKDLEEKIAKIGSMIAVARQTAASGQEEMKMAAEATLKIRWIRL